MHRTFFQLYDPIYKKTKRNIFYISYTFIEELRRFDDWTSGRRGRGKYQTSAILLSIGGKGNVLVHVVHPGSRCLAISHLTINHVFFQLKNPFRNKLVS